MKTALHSNAVSLIVLFGIGLTFSGCFSNPDRLIPVSGSVKYGGKPLTSGIIIFTPADELNGTIASAEIEADGSFHPQVSHSNRGMKAGEYQVSITYLPNFAQLTPNQMVQKQKDILSIPKKYSDPRTSGLKVTIQKKSANQLELELED
ncbi:hypothetical protein SH661x_002787 [Planctomicrobium sp. SH661]|uniref:hypothetical protein n=1 Tax=Planctomicrobium sp. SH661 TaxID=3448124 RepID=UPI003F5CA6E0